MRELPVNDFYVKNGRVREDGRLVHDMLFAQVKTPAEYGKPWDYYKILSVILAIRRFGLSRKAAVRWSRTDLDVKDSIFDAMPRWGDAGQTAGRRR
jgi:hypothetical protein